MKKLLISSVIASALCANTALVQAAEKSPVVGVGYATLSDDIEGQDVTVGALLLSAGVRVQSESGKAFFQPDVRIGFGLGDDTVNFQGLPPINVELDRFMALSLRGGYEVNEKLYMFIQPSYANAKFTASVDLGNNFNVSASDDAWEAGIGAGIGIQANEKVGIELALEDYDGTTAFSISSKFSL